MAETLYGFCFPYLRVFTWRQGHWVRQPLSEQNENRKIQLAEVAMLALAWDVMTLGVLWRIDLLNPVTPHGKSALVSNSGSEAASSIQKLRTRNSPHQEII
jgi:hypothetical protein